MEAQSLPFGTASLYENTSAASYIAKARVGPNGQNPQKKQKKVGKKKTYTHPD